MTKATLMYMAGNYGPGNHRKEALSLLLFDLHNPTAPTASTTGMRLRVGM